MKSSSNIILAIALVGLATAHAANPREELKQLTAQLQSNPSDTALREKIIKLAQTIKPAPAVPEEAQRRMVRGAAAFKGARNQNDYKDAVREFEQASLAAPWSGDIYYNLGLAQDKAGDHASAVRSLKLALLASPTSKETKSLFYEVEYRLEKANSPAAQATKKRDQEAAVLRALDGAVFVKEQTSSGSPFMKYTVEIRGRQATYKSIYLVGGPVENVDGTCVLDGLQCEMEKKWAYTKPTRILLKISQDGREVVRTVYTDDVVSSEMVLRRAE